MVQLLILDISGDVREVEKKITPSFKLDDTLPLTVLKGVIEHKGKSKLERLAIWNDDNLDIHVYGFTKGSDDIQNVHSLPAPLDNRVFYGDILLIGYCDDTFVDMNESIYLDFFSNHAFDEHDDDLPEDAVDVDEEEEEYLEPNDDLEESTEFVIEIQDDDAVIPEVYYCDELQLEPEWVPIN